jgi:hypothetical protein
MCHAPHKKSPLFFGIVGYIGVLLTFNLLRPLQKQSFGTTDSITTRTDHGGRQDIVRVA